LKILITNSLSKIGQVADPEERRA